MKKTLNTVILSKPFGIIHLLVARTTSTKSQLNIEECYNILGIPINSRQDVVRNAFLELAKKYHPDSGSPDADINKFVTIENAFRALSKHNTGSSKTDEVKQIVYDIRHTAPQHRQYLSFEGIGHGTPFQRQKQWAQSRAQRAAVNVMEHRVAKAVASDKTLMKKDHYAKKHDIKTKYGFDRLVEDLIQESMSKGEFENLSGKGKPLKDQNNNPYVDFTTHKLNEVLINNGFTPEWITMSKEIEQDIKALKDEVQTERMYLGKFPLNEEEQMKWNKICSSNKDLANSINNKINTYNLIVPLLNKQKLHVDFESICRDILEHGIHSVKKPIVKESRPVVVSESEDVISMVFKVLGDFLSFKEKKKNVDN